MNFSDINVPIHLKSTLLDKSKYPSAAYYNNQMKGKLIVQAIEPIDYNSFNIPPMEIQLVDDPKYDFLSLLSQNTFRKLIFSSMKINEL